MHFGLLGPLTVLDDDGAPVELGGRQPRLVLAALLAADGRAVSAEALIDALWGEDPPASATGTIQSYVSRLRRALGAERLSLDDAGYRLDVAGADVDFRRFEALAEAGRSDLDRGDPAGARHKLLDAAALWRGPALGEFADRDFATGLATRLEERRLAAVEDRIEADLRLGRHAAIIGELSELVAAHPLRERLQGQLALALYRADRQADALRAIADAGRVLREELGIEPGASLRSLEASILAHDPALDLAAASPTPAAAAAPPVAPAAPAVPDPTGAAGSGGAGPRPGVPLVGRSDELRTLVQALDEASTEGRFVVIEGEPGIGKTRLADELRAIAAERGSVAVWGRSDEGGAAPALWPWLAPLRRLAAAAPDVGASLQELVDASTPMNVGQAESTQFERFEEVASLLATVGAEHPVVVLLDDLQWADATSLELVAFLAGRLDRGVLVVATTRPLEVGRNDAVTDALAAIARRPGSRRLVLRGLTAAETAELLDAASARAVTADEATAIHSRAEGNPFYAIELVRLHDEERGTGGQVPGTIGDVVRRRLAHLPEATADLLVLAAVVGRDVALPLLARAADRPLDQVFDELEPAIVHRLLVDGEQPGALRFSHALVREVLLEDITSLRRARLHLRVADAIEAAGTGVDDEEILAEHLWQAAPVGVGKRAADALQRAAEVAIRRVSYAAAEELLTRAVQLRRATGSSVEDDEAELRAIVRLLEVARARRYFQGATDPELVQRARTLADRCGQRELVLTIMWFESAALATASRRQEHHAIANAFRELTADDPDPRIRSLGLETLGISRWGDGDIDGAIEHLDGAMDLLAQAPPPQDAFAAEHRLITETFWIWNHAAHGDLSRDEAFQRFDAMVAAAGAERFGIASICGFAVTTAVFLMAWEHAERFLAVAREADPAAQFAFWAGQMLMCEGILLARAGRADEAKATFADGHDRYTTIGGRSATPTYLAAFGECLAGIGMVDEGRDHVARAHAVLEVSHERWNIPRVLIAEALVAHAAGADDRVAGLLDDAAAVATAQGAHVVAQMAGDLAAAVVDGGSGAAPGA